MTTSTTIVVDVAILINASFVGRRFGRPLTSRGRKNFASKVSNDGGFEIGKRGKDGEKGTKGGLDKHKHLVLRILVPEDYPEGVAARAEKEKEDFKKNVLPENANTGKGPIVGPGIPNNGNFFAVIDGEHRITEFPLQYVALPFFGDSSG